MCYRGRGPGQEVGDAVTASVRMSTLEASCTRTDASVVHLVEANHHRVANPALQAVKGPDASAVAFQSILIVPRAPSCRSPRQRPRQGP